MRGVVLRRGVVAGIGVFVVVLVVGAGPAFAGPWWRALSNSRPSYLQALHHALVPGIDEVQDVSISGPPGEKFVLANITPEEFASEEFHNAKHERRYVTFTVGESAAAIQVGLESGGLYGAGNVEVTEVGSGGAEYAVKFKGALAEQPVEGISTLINTDPEFEPVASVTVTQATVGRGRSQPPDGFMVATVVNVGDESTSGGSQIRDVLPAGLRAVSVEGVEEEQSNHIRMTCLLEGQHEAVCGVGAMTPFNLAEVRVGVIVENSAVSGEENTVSVSGGGAPAYSFSRPITISGAPVPFGVEDYEVTPEEEGGGIDTQAGSHPFQTTFAIGVNQEEQTTSPYNGQIYAAPAGLARDLNDKLPPGLIGNPQPFAKCTDAQFLAKVNLCPPGSVVGAAVVTIDEPDVLGLTTFSVPVFNLEPTVGEPARFGFLPLNRETPVYIDTSVRTGSDYGVTGEVHNVPQTAGFLTNFVTLWGVPGDAHHDSTRGYSCLESAGFESRYSGCEKLYESEPPPFFEMPTSCTGPLQSSVEVDSWETPGKFEPPVQAQPITAMDGCNRLAFSPTIEVAPDRPEASSPSGLLVNIKVPQEESASPKGIAESDIRDTTVTLPVGVTVNPSGADGLEACSEGLVGYQPEGSEPPGSLMFTPKLPSPLEQGLNFCPDASKVGTVRLKTPILKNPLVGSVYLAAQNANPFGSLIAMYLVASDPESGVLVKLAGEVQLDPQTGQITTTFLNTPQAPAEEIELHLFGGEHAPLSMPTHCGSYPTTTTFTPWSGNEPVHPSASFQITSGPNHTPCPGTLPFAPTMTAGSTSNQAGAFATFSTTISREDSNQHLGSVQVHLPPGVAAILKGVPRCSETQANAGTCSTESLLGEATASVGVGGSPYTVTGGKIYLTGPYQGAPFGLSIVTPAIAGPYNLGLVIVRAKLEINPRTAQATVTTNPPGSPYSIPASLDGIPLQIKRINATINRPKFTFNPTNCDPLTATGTATSIEGATSAVFSSPFQAVDCTNLTFAPKVTVTAGGHASKLNGASLHFKISYPKAPLGTQSWFNEAKFDLPKQLPARLETLQRACLATVFENNRAACPKASKIGTATVHTPVLAAPFTGTVYFVSYGNQKFPEAVIVLNAENITIELHGETFINKKTGVTSATFRDTPDVPFETIEVNIPTGRYSEFGTNLPNSSYNLCGHKLTTPTLLKAQNGQQINQNTPITITNCKKPHKHTTQHHKKK
jgi:hypothetical protein